MKTKSLLHPSGVFAALAVSAASLLAVGALHAQSLNWDPTSTGGTSGGGSGTWNTGTTTAWYNGTSDQTWTDTTGTTTAIFGGAAGTVTIGSGGVSAYGLQFNKTGYTLQTGTITIYAGGITTTVASTTINAPITLGATQTWSVASGDTLTIEQGIKGTASTNLTLSGSGTYFFTNVTTSGFNSAATVTFGTGAIWEMGLSNSQGTGTWFGSNGTAGNGAVITFQGNNTIESNGATGRFVNNNINLQGNITFGTTSSAGGVNLYGTIDLTGSTRTITVKSSSTINGAIISSNNSSTTGLIVSASSTSLTLKGANTFGGGFTLNSGTVLVNNAASSAFGTGTVSIASGATLGGTGSFTGAATVNGTITSGPAVGGIGTLNTGALTLTSSASYKLTLNSTTTTTDLVAVTGNLTLAGTLSATDAGAATLAANTSFTIMTYTGSLSGAFSNAADGSTITIGSNTYVLNYGLAGDSGNTGYVSDAITLTVVPEPSTVALTIIFGAGMLMLFRRRSHRV